MIEPRLVVTGHDDSGRAVFRHDGLPPGTVDIPDGIAVHPLLWLPRHPVTADEGGDFPPQAPIGPPPGGLAARLIRIPPAPPGTPEPEQWFRVDGDDPERPGRHTTDTLDVMVVLEGEIVLGLDDGEHALGSGDVVVQRATPHRWKVVGDGPCTYAVFMLAPEPGAPPPSVRMAPAGSRPEGALGPRRLVTANDAGGRSFVLADGRPPSGFQPGGPDGVTMVELWQTGGALRASDQGGDPAEWTLHPPGDGIALKYIEMPPGLDSGEAGWHTTDTIDIDVVLTGRVELALPDVPPVVIGPGGAVVQRRTNHKWTPVGDETASWVAILIALRGPS